MNLEGSKILLGVTGSIAVYKAVTLVRELVKAGAEVKVIMTKGATDFVAPLTFSTLSKNPVIIQYANEQDGTWNNHVELALWADLFIIAPATANTIAKCANGICDNVMMATYLSAKCPVALAPAMDLDMYKHPATKKNISTIQFYGNIIIPAEHGELASGLVGEGRMAEPANIISFIQNI